ncbi:hypothetical protein P9112_000855 [Eukaryota sp. TZLM1-RC]
MGVHGLSSYIGDILSTKGHVVQTIDFNQRQQREITFSVDFANFVHGIADSFCKNWYYGAPDGTFYPSLVELFSELKKRNIIFHFYLEVDSTKSVDEKEHESNKRSKQRCLDMRNVQADLKAELPTNVLRGKRILTYCQLIFLLTVKAATAVGFPFSIVNGEGDYAMAKSCRQTNVFGVISGDSDFCTFPLSTWVMSGSIGGWRKLLRSLQFNKRHTVKYISNSRLKSYLQVDPIDIAVLAGCDMTKVQLTQYMKHNVREWNPRSSAGDRIQYIVNHLQRVNGLKKCQHWSAYCDRNTETCENYLEIRNFFENYSNSDGSASQVVVTSAHEIFSAWSEAICTSNCLKLPITLFYTVDCAEDSDGGDVKKEYISITSLKKNLIFCVSALYRRCYLHENDNYEVLLRGQFEPNELVQIDRNYEVNPEDYLLPCIDAELLAFKLPVKITLLTKLVVFLASGRVMDDDTESSTMERLNSLIRNIPIDVSTLLPLIPILRFLAEKTMFSDIKDSCKFITMSDLGLLVFLICHRYLAPQWINFKKESRSCFDTIFTVQLIRSCFSDFTKIFSLVKIDGFHELLPYLDFAALSRFSGEVKRGGVKFRSFNELFRTLLKRYDVLLGRMVNRENLLNLSMRVCIAAFGDLEISDKF